MAIRKEFRKYYGPAFRRFRLALIAAHGPVCMKCRRNTPKYLAVAHITHDPRHSEVRLFCASCHAKHDAKQAYAMRRRNWSRRYGQLWLWAEIEWEAFPEWMRPRARPEQGRLF